MTLVATSQANTYHPSPTPSLVSISSGTSTIWSVRSATSSNATSVASSTIDNFSAPSTAILPSLSAQTILGADLQRRATAPTSRGSTDQYGVRHPHPCPKPSNIPHQPLPIEQRQNPRRTNRLLEANAQPCSAAEGCAMPPVPSLQRQADRKVNFVENLVDSAAQIVETIWQPPKYITAQMGPKDAVLPLRTFIQETLRRSRTSYSTLQVALYYLIVIRPHLPGMDFDVSELDAKETQLVRAKQCGRRMFLAALILASKYLQDRNYSARAWSKISGLNTQEITVNEMAFLKAVDWKLHISEVVFQKWTDLVLKYTSAPSPSPVSPTRSSPWNDEEQRKREWCELILCLSPDLREVELGGSDMIQTKPLAAQIEFGPPLAPAAVAPPTLRKTHSMPAPCALPPRSIDARVQNNNAFKALHRPLPNAAAAVPFPPSLRRQSPRPRLVTSASEVCAPAESARIGGKVYNGMARPTTPKIGAMASVARSAMSSALSGCSQEAYPSALTGRRSDSGEHSPRRSSLATCVLRSDRVESTPPGNPVFAMPAFKRQESSGMHRIAGKKYVPGTPVIYLPAAVPPPGSPAKLASMNTTEQQQQKQQQQQQQQQQHRLVMASPKSTEAAWTLNLLREAPSPATSVGSLTPTTSSIGRKRSCPSVAADGNFGSASSGVTPKFRGLKGFASPNMRCAGSPIAGSPSLSERCGKRARSGWEMDGLLGVAQGVR